MSGKIEKVLQIENLEEKLNSFFKWMDNLLAGQIYGREELLAEIEKDIWEKSEKYLLQLPPKDRELIQKIDKELIPEQIKKIRSRYKTDSEITQELSHSLEGYSKEKSRRIVIERFNSRYGSYSDVAIQVLEIEPRVRVYAVGPPHLTAEIIYKITSKELQGDGKIVLQLYSADEIWAGVEIELNLDFILEWIDKDIIEASNWKSFEEATGIKEKAMKKLAERLRGYLPINIRNLVREQVESRYGSRLNPNIVLVNEETEADVVDGNDPAIVITLPWAVETTDGAIIEEAGRLFLTLQSKDNIKEIVWEE